MSQGIVKTRKFNDGEGVFFDDFNDMQAYAEAQLNDGLLSAEASWGLEELIIATGPGVGYQPNSAALFALRGGHAMPTPTGTNLQVTNTPGQIMQTSGSAIDGTSPKMLKYWCSADELQTTCDAADATNPRIDMVAVKLEYVDGSNVAIDFKDATSGVITSQNEPVTREVKLTKQYVKGTASATPAVPSTPAGFVPWLLIRVPATFASTFVPSTHLRDVRIPLGGYSMASHPGGTAIMDPSKWTQQTNGLWKNTSGGNADMILMLPRWSYLEPSRLTALTGSWNIGLSGGVVQIGDVTPTPSGFTFSSQLDITSIITGGGLDNTYGVLWQSTLGDVTPIWANGLFCQDPAGTFESARLGVKVTCNNNSYIGFLNFHMRGGVR